MDKMQQAAYLVNLLTLIESFERGGGQRSTTLTREYERAYEDLRSTLDEEHEEKGKANG